MGSGVRHASRALLCACLLAIISGVLASPSSAMAVSVTTEKLTNDTYDRAHIAIDGDHVVYDSLRNGNRDIYLFDLATGVESRITTHPAEQFWPSIDGDRITFFDRRKGTQYSMGGIPYYVYYPEVYVYDMTLGVETHITGASYMDGGWPWNAPGEGPLIEGDRVVWCDYEADSDSSDVYIYDIIDRDITQVSSPKQSGDYMSPKDHRVSVSGDRVMFYADDYFRSSGSSWWSAPAKAYIYDLNTTALTPFTPNRAGEPFEPKLWGDRVLGRERDATFYGTWEDAVVYDATTQARTPVAISTAPEYPVDIWGDRAIWRNAQTGRKYLADLNSGVNNVWQLPSDAATGTVRISGDNIVWTDSSADLSVGRIVEDQAPVTTSNIPEGWSAGPVSVTLSATCADGVAATYYRIGEGAAQTYSTPFSVSAEGRTRIRYWSESSTGKIEGLTEEWVRIDSAAPVVVPHTGVPNQYGGEVLDDSWIASNATEKWRTLWLKLYLQPEDISGSAVHYRINNGPEVAISGAEPVYFDSATDGSKRVEFWAIDSAGNSSAHQTIYLNFDGANPVTTTTAASAWRAAPFQVSLSATDTTSGLAHTYYKTSTNGSSWDTTSTYTGTPITFDQEGPRFLKYWSVDVAGRVETAKTINVGIDRTAPHTTTDAYQSWNSYGDYFAFYSSDTMSGVASTWYRVNGGPAQQVTLGQDQLVSAEGDNLIEFWSYDAVGNREATQTAHIRVDTGGPTVSSNIPDTWPAEGFTVEIYAEDSGSGVKEIHYQINGRNGAPSQGDTIYTGPFWVPGGEMEVTYWAIDNVGYTSSYQTDGDLWGGMHTSTTDFAVCGSCHSNQLPEEHEYVSNCGTCHSPDYRRHEPAMCVGCHSFPLPGYYTYQPGSPNHSGCESCHAPGWAPPEFLGHQPEQCMSCHAGFWGQERVYEPEMWGYPHTGCESCHGFPVPLTPVQRSVALGEKMCESCHGWGLHPDYWGKHQTTTDMTTCSSCHQSNLVSAHPDCATCHTNPNATVKSAMTNHRTDCAACHAANHPHPAGDVSALANGQRACSVCHSSDIIAEHSKSTSAGHEDPCDTCHASGGPRQAMGGASWDGQCDNAACHGEGTGREVHANYCLACHDQAQADFSVAKTAFPDVAPVDRETACKACHAPGLVGTHPYHQAGANCGAACHPEWGTSLSSATPAYTDPSSGASFGSAESKATQPALLHTIHATSRWPGSLEFASSACASCHAVAACSACHAGAVPATHGEHSSSDQTGNPAWRGRVAHGVTGGDQTQRSSFTDSNQCASAACHDLAGTAAKRPHAVEDYNHAIGGNPDDPTVANTAVTLAGTWRYRASVRYSGGRMSYANLSGAALEASFTGERIEVISDKDPYRGIAEVYIDGALAGTFDGYAPTTRYQAVVFSADVAPGSHTISIRPLGNKSTSSRGTFVVVDAFRVYSDLPGSIAPECRSCHADRTVTHW